MWRTEYNYRKYLILQKYNEIRDYLIKQDQIEYTICVDHITSTQYDRHKRTLNISLVNGDVIQLFDYDNSKYEQIKSLIFGEA
jgi:hypothetical protein